MASARRAWLFSPLPLPQPPAPSPSMKISLATCSCSLLLRLLFASSRRDLWGSGRGSLLLCSVGPAVSGQFLSPCLSRLTGPFIPTTPTPALTHTYHRALTIFFSCCCFFGETPLEAWSWVPCRNQGMQEAWWYHPWKSAGCRQLIL